MRPIHLTVLAALVLAPPGAAAGEWDLCPPQPAPPPVDLPAPDAPGVTRGAADHVRRDGPLTVLEGDVQVRRGGRTLGAGRVELERAGNHARASGGMSLSGEGYFLRGERGEVDLDSGALEMESLDYSLQSMHAQGRASRIERDADRVSRLEEATYSTCPERDQDWYLAGEEVTLNPNNRQGTARNVSLWFHGVPLFYAPWFRFPIGSARLSGFLAPGIGSSSESGMQVAVPWYWNIAPNLDATLTPRWLERRGTQLRSEWRWLGPAGFWQLDNEYLPGDDLAGIDRDYTRIRQHASSGRWGTRIDAAGVSDPDYFEDLGDTISLSSQTHLRRRADLTWTGRNTHFRGRLQGYQTIDEDIAPGNRPYEQLPQLVLDHAGEAGALETRLASELVQFEREASDTATRLRLVPSVTWPIEAPGWFLRPRLAVDHTSYRIDRYTTAGPERIDRTLPVASIDSGLVFDRFGAAYQQTLEPRLFYVYVPEEAQDDIPVFDSGRYGFSFAQLFRERRFTGGDRVGDSNRLTLALTSRALDRAGGHQVFRGSIGVIRHFADRRVTLPNEPVADARDEPYSDVVAELAVDPTRRWGADLGLQWDPDDERTNRGDLSLRYRGPGGGVANLGYRFTRDAQEQVDVSAAWPVSARWDLVGRVNWSLRDERNIESLAGFEYDSCCWRLRTVARQYLNEDDDSADGTDQSTAVYLELTLKGLGAVGDPAGQLLERAILGYRDPSD